MGRLGVKIACCLILLNIFLGYSQQILQHSNDTLPVIVRDSLILVPDTVNIRPPSAPTTPAEQAIQSLVVVDDTTPFVPALEKKICKPNPAKAVIYSAIFPGLGQIYNRKYWKLPIVYGGFLGFSYAISWNGRYYNDYSTAYKDVMDDDPLTNSWENMLPYGQDPATVDKEWLKTVLKRRKDFYRRYRDLSIIGTVAMYGLAMLDAYVDAQLFDFDISPDLSFRVEPTIIQKTDYLANSFGVQCSFSF